METQKLRPLTDDQARGFSCVVCGDDSGPHVPVPGVETPLSSQVFRCPGCQVDPGELARRVEATFRPRLPLW